jgi:dihydropteroate synthase
MNEIIVKIANKNIVSELNSIGFDGSYIDVAKNKYKTILLKVFDLKPYEANILKQDCLSLGFDCAVSRDSITCKCETTDCIINATYSQYQKLVKKLITQPFRLKKVAEKIQNILIEKIEPIIINDFIFDWSRPYIMGILNVTPDSFSDGGKYNTVDNALNHCIKMIEDGADIIDIGGESTRPDAEIVSIEEEINRCIPVIKKIRQEGINIPISIDTRNFETAKLAIENGCNIINDVSGLDYDEKLFNYVCENNLPVIIMHSDKVPAISKDFSNSDIVEEVYISLNKKISKLINNGLDKKNIIADIGIGFGKSKNSNFELLQRFNEFCSLNVPLLIGISRKSFIRNEFNIDVENSDIPTALYSAMLKNVNIHRVHNVKLTKTYLDFASKII